MKRSALWIVTVIIVSMGLAGCGRNGGGPDPRIARLERELADRAQEIAELRAEVERGRAKEDTLTAELVRVKVERDKLKQEIAALKKKKY